MVHILVDAWQKLCWLLFWRLLSIQKIESIVISFIKLLELIIVFLGVLDVRIHKRMLLDEVVSKFSSTDEFGDLFVASDHRGRHHHYVVIGIRCGVKMPICDLRQIFTQWRWINTLQLIDF